MNICAHCPTAHGIGISHECSVGGLLYADDYVLLANSPIELNLLLKALHDYATENEITINAKKSKVMDCASGWGKGSWRWLVNTDT